MQLVLMEWQMGLGAFCSVLLHIVRETSPSHICHLLVKLQRAPWGRTCGRTVSSHPLTPEPWQRGNIHQDQLRGTAGPGAVVPDVFMMLEDSWHSAAGGGIQPGPSCIPADPCATGKQPVGQDTRIWGSKCPWILTSCVLGAPAVPDGDVPLLILCLSSKDTLSPLSWLWPAFLCANINLGFSLAQPGSSQGETPPV